jgi:xanthine dehydrogenase accessory factor
MRELIETIDSWMRDGKQVAIATVVEVYGSAPRRLGSKMAVNQAGLMAGSVSGGCVEGAVVAEAAQVLKSGKSKLLHYGISNEQAFNVGLACGGTIEVFVEALPGAEFEQMKDDLLRGQMFAKVTVLSGPDCGEKILVFPDGRQIGQLSSPALKAEIDSRLAELFARQVSQRFSVEEPESKVEVFFDIQPPLPQMIIVGAVHIAIPLVTYAKSLGFHTIVLDPRKAFSNRERFPHADELILEWPDDYIKRVGLNEGSYVITVSHDEKLDVPALALACTSKARYIGALGSKKTSEKNKQAIHELGVPEEAIARIYSPVGLKIGAHGAEEIALSIMAQVIAVRNGIA